MKCCNKQLIVIFKKDEITYYEDKIILEEDDNIFAPYIELDEDEEYIEHYETITRIKGDIEAYLFCKKCKKIYYYYDGPIHCDTNEYSQNMHEISLEELIKFLSNNLLVNPELIDFNNLNKLCNALEINISDFIRNIAFNIVHI